jgi:AraC family transcriptional regulator
MAIITRQLDRASFEPYNDVGDSDQQLLPHLTIEPISANWFECSKEWLLAPRRLGDSYLSWIISGHGHLLLGDEHNEYIIGSGDLVLFPQYCLHSIIPDADSAMSMINVRFNARLYGIIDLLSHYNMGGVYKDVARGLFNSHSCEAAREYCLKPVGWRQSLTARIELILLELIRNQKNLPVQTGNVSKLSRLEPVFRLIESRLADPDLTVADMAARLDVSEVYLRKIFRSQLGVSPIKYLRRRRIDLACSLLSNTVLPIRQIAIECGFHEVQFFHRVFRDMTGTTPGNYRQSPDF